MTRTELLEHYLKPTDLTVKELIDRNSFAQIMQFAEAYHLEQLRIGGVSQQRELLMAYFEWEQKQDMNIESYQKSYLIDEFLDSL
jgi:hypothetical protein